MHGSTCVLTILGLDRCTYAQNSLKNVISWWNLEVLENLSYLPYSSSGTLFLLTAFSAFMWVAFKSILKNTCTVLKLLLMTNTKLFYTDLNSPPPKKKQKQNLWLFHRKSDWVTVLNIALQLNCKRNTGPSFTGVPS